MTARFTHRRFLSRGAFLGVALLTASLALAQVPIGQLGPDGVTVKGRVADIFGEKFVLEDESGRILVEMQAAPGQVPALRQGETLLVTGLQRNRVLDARRVVRENGEVAFSGSTPPTLPSQTETLGRPVQPVPLAAAPVEARLTANGIAATLRSVGLTAVGEPVRHRKHIEIPTRAADGTDVVVSLDRLGRLWEIEDADHDNKRVPVRLTSTGDVERALRQAGFSPQGEIERRRHHYEALATNPQGDLVEAHINLSGRIYKQTWTR